MAKDVTLFIPDISGFTEFVHNTDIAHSSHIISELLSILLEDGQQYFKLVEIEGDAVFFYKEYEATDVALIQEQIKKMYISFHAHLKRYEYERICQCGACSSAYNLAIKFIVHRGTVDFVKIKDRVKLHGSPVIQIHRLLKNAAPIEEYALITTALIQSTEELGNNEHINYAKESYDFGEIAYHYYPIVKYKQELPYVPPIPENIPKTMIYNQTEVLYMPIFDLYEVISNFDYRLLWNKGIDKLEYENNKVNRAGIKHQCLINKNNLAVTTSRKKTKENQLVYGETTKDIPHTKKFSIYYVLEEVEPGKTKLNIEVFADFKWLGFLYKPILVKNLKKNIPENIKELILLIDSEFKIET